MLARAALHRWEEPLSPAPGARGPFFSGCSLGCVFCQNEAIRHRDFGKAVTLERLARICGELVDQGPTTSTSSTPTHYAHVVGRLLEEHPQPVPVVWNSRRIRPGRHPAGFGGKIQIYLPDLKYLDSDAAGRYSGAPDYPQTAQAAIREMVRQTGPCAFDGDGLLTRGVVIRHLILPGQVSQAKAVMDWVAAEFGPGTVLFSLMSQYTPWGRSAEFPEIHRRLRAGEMRAAAEYMANLGLEGFTQERTSAQREYTPPFDLTGVAGREEHCDIPGPSVFLMKREAVLSAAAALALLSMLWVPPDGAYLSYVDWRTMAQLFCLMAVMAGLQGAGGLQPPGPAAALPGQERPPAGVCAGLSVLFHQHGHHQRCGPAHLCPLFPGGADTGRTGGRAVPVVVFQTVAANLGSMATPIGNPQNLYLYAQSGRGLGIFWP